MKKIIFGLAAFGLLWSSGVVANGYTFIQNTTNNPLIAKIVLLDNNNFQAQDDENYDDQNQTISSDDEEHDNMGEDNGDSNTNIDETGDNYTDY